jgi:hypothetical protein
MGLTYKTAVDRFRTLHRIYSFGKPQIKLSEKEIFMLITGAYAELANKHKLIMKYSTDNTTAQTNLVAGQTEYTSGTGATNIPSDMLDVYNVTLNDTNKTQLERLNITSIDMITSGTPSGYAIDKTNKVLKLNFSPTNSYASDSAMRLIIHYFQRIEPYTGTATGTYASLDFTASDYGDSFDTDDLWSDLIVFKAVSEVCPEKKEEAMIREKELIRTKPSFYSYSLPYYNGTYEDFTDTTEAGSDYGGRS